MGMTPPQQPTPTSPTTNHIRPMHSTAINHNHWLCNIMHAKREGWFASPALVPQAWTTQGFRQR
eukprot:NODE_1160_length_1071_cov_100.362035_g896_i0.p5 GENE.NODE_1160_length_1071_cov_100.362035_g896_i0~~NODE_1160_length_1071_cov_100.362035_g896_i0.p5  ORF type:complete len:64 (-),score=14.39 NODE_1160_length_1071_cov_100.362035_g896_i0:742-933(-)